MTFSGQVRTLTWGQIFNMTFHLQIIYHSTRLDKRNTMLATESLCLYWVKSNYRKTFIAKKRLFLEFLLPGGQTDDLRWNRRTRQRTRVKRAIEYAFVQHCSSSSSRVMRQFVEKCWNRPNLNFGDLRWPDLWPDLKVARCLSVIIFDALLIAAHRVSIR